MATSIHAHLSPVSSTAAPARAGGSRSPAKKHRDLFRDVTLLGETWERFPRGGVPLGLLKDMAMALEDSAKFRVKEDLVPYFLWTEDSTPMWRLSATARHEPRCFAALNEHDLEILMEQDVERLVRTLLVPKHAEYDLRRDAMLGALERLGQVYHCCRRRWKKARARELFWGAVQRVCLHAKKGYRMIEVGKQAEARRKVWEAEQREAQRQALARLGDYAI